MVVRCELRLVDERGLRMTLVTNNAKSVTQKVFSDDQIVQILALDGGGLMGLYSAAAIEAIEEQLGHSLCRHFDIITGTSTGGLIALALGLGMGGTEIVQFYKTKGPEIFPRKIPRRWVRRGWLINKYSPSELERTLKEMLVLQRGGDVALLSDSQKRLIIPTFYAGTSRPRLLKTPHDKRYKLDWKMPMWAVAMATAAAPTYVPSFTYQDKTYLDGGLWANNPSLVGVVEALEMGAKLENIRVLNISTTSSESDCLEFKVPLLPMKAPASRLGKLPWASRILPVVMRASSYSMTRMYLQQMLAAGNLAVIDDQLNDGHADLDCINYGEFYERGRSAGEQAWRGIAQFFDQEASPYIPCKEAMA